MQDIAGVVLAGGLSSRMGTDKSQLTFNNQTLLEKTKNLLKKTGIQKVFESGPNGIKDLHVNHGPLGGIISCLTHLTPYKDILFVPVDMPLLQVEVLIHLIENHKRDLSHLAHYKFPFILTNTEKIRTIINTQIEHKELSLNQLFKQLNTTIIEHDFEEELFLNTNSPQQWQKAKKQLQLQEQ